MELWAAASLGWSCLRFTPFFPVKVSRSRPVCNESSAKAHGPRTMLVSGGGSKKEEIGKIYGAPTAHEALIRCQGESFKRKKRADIGLALGKHKCLPVTKATSICKAAHSSTAEY